MSEKDAAPDQSFPMPETSCPVCDIKLNRAARMTQDGLPPELGDATVCVACGSVLEYTEGMMLVEASEKTLAECAGEPEFLVALNVAARFKDGKK